MERELDPVGQRVGRLHHLFVTGKEPMQLAEQDFLALLGALDGLAAVSASARHHARTRLFALQEACYQLGMLAAPPRQGGPGRRSPAELAAAIIQPDIRGEVIRYAMTSSTTLLPASVQARIKTVMVFCDYLAEHQPQVRRLDQLDRATHVEPFLAWARHRPWRGANGAGRTVSLSQFHHDVVDLRVFFDDIACWGWASAPSRRLLFTADIPRLPEPLPRALTPDVDRALMGAVTSLANKPDFIGDLVSRERVVFTSVGYFRTMAYVADCVCAGAAERP